MCIISRGRFVLVPRRLHACLKGLAGKKVTSSLRMLFEKDYSKEIRDSFNNKFTKLQYRDIQSEF